MNQQSSYRRDIDGLRAVAVLLVIGFHAAPGRITGGYVGVDIFFVISGFLITGLLLQDLEKKEFSFSAFYARRIRRIFPALVTVLVVCFAAGWVLLLPRELTSLGLNIFGGAAFTSNLVLLSETSYFDLSALQKPLLHLWSLGVEEQFYIIWPILLLLAFSRRLSIAILAATLLVVSFVWNVKEAGTPADFYLPLTRAWELMIGGVMAAFVSQSDRFKLKRVLSLIQSALNWKILKHVAAVWTHRDVRAVIAIVLIGMAVIGLDKSSDFPGWWAILPTFGAAIIISAEGSWFNRKILSNPIAVRIGLVSYPLYLWHWPLLSFASLASPELSRQVRVAAVLTAVVLAWMTFRWIELPIRQGQNRKLKVVVLCIAMTLVGGVGLITFHWRGFPFRLPTAIRDIAKVSIDPEFERTVWRLHTCLLETHDTKSQFAADCIERGHRPLLFLWGDSYAAALYPGLKNLQQSVDFGLAQYTTAGCPPLPSLDVLGRPHCAENNKFVLSILSDVRPDIVLLYSAWAPAYGNMLPPLKELIAKLRALNIRRIVVMGPPPDWPGGLPEAAAQYYMLVHKMMPVRSNFHLAKSGLVYEQQFRDQILSLSTEYISSWDALCDGDKCLTRLGDKAGDLVALDNVHLSVAGSIYLARAIAPCLFSDKHSWNSIDGVDRSLVCRPSNDGESVETKQGAGSR